MAQTEVMRAYRVALDPTQAQRASLASHAGASRRAYNYHLAARMAAHRLWSQEVAFATYIEHGDHDPADALVEAKKTVRQEKRAPFPTYMDTMKVFCADPANAWYREVNRYALSSGMQAADRAWANWVESRAGKRSGRNVEHPRFHAKGRTRDSFTLFHDVRKPTLRPEGYRRLVLPEKISGRRGGSVRLHGNLRRLARRIRRGTAQIQSVTISRGGRHWHVSVLAKETIEIPDRPSATQRAGGPVGVELGARHYAALSTGDLIEHPRHVRRAEQRLARAQRALSRTGWWVLDESGGAVSFSRRIPRRGVRKRATAGRWRARGRVARLQAELAERRATTQHSLTKRLATGHDVIAVQDHLHAVTATARGSRKTPGRSSAAKAGLNQGVLDVGYGAIRRQLAYKTVWYGSQLVLADRHAPTSKTCSACGTVKAKLSLGEQEYHCTTCGSMMDRDVNSSRNVLTAAGVMHDDACGPWESLTADRAAGTGASLPEALTSEGQGPRAPATPVEESAGHPPQSSQRTQQQR